MKKLRLKRSKQSETPPARITNETVAEHRERVLAGGRRFKYPRQYARHKLVFNAIIISLVALIIFGAVVWQQLYVAQNTGTFFYRLTRIVPLPVATVDGAQVRYSDYLISLSGSEHYLEQSERLNLDSDDGRRQIEFIKRQALDGAVADTYAAKIAAEKGITVSDAQVDAVINASLDTVSGRISQAVYDDSTYSTLGYSAEEYRHLIHQALVKQEVAYAVDTTATAAKKRADAYLSAAKKPSLTALSKQLRAKGYDVIMGASGLVPTTNHDGGLSQKAAALHSGKLSGVFRSTTGDGYYVVQLTSKSDTQLSYNFIRIPLTKFAERLKTLAKNKQIHEYISVKKAADTVIRR
jgi:hypothetical protein